MPQLGETVTEGTITKWYKAVGDQVARDEPLFEVSTDKVDSEVPSPAEGVLPRSWCRRGTPWTWGSSWPSSAARRRPTETPHRPPPTPAPEPIPSPTPSPAEAPPPLAPPPAAEPAPGGDGASAPAAVARPADRGGAFGRGPGASVRGTPRRAGRARAVTGGQALLNEHDIDPSSVPGTGLGGRITRADVEALVGTADASPPAAPAARPAVVPSIADGKRRTRPVRLSAPPGRGPRRGQRPDVRAGRGRGDPLHQHPQAHRRAHGPLQGHLRPHPHGQGDRLRTGRAGAAGLRRTLPVRGGLLPQLPALRRPSRGGSTEDFPHLNSSVGEDALIVHRNVNLGIAVDLDNEGLIVPVVHNAEELNLRGHGAAHPRCRRTGPDQATQSRRHQRGHVLHHQRRAVRHAAHRCRSSTSRRWPSCPPTG